MVITTRMVRHLARPIQHEIITELYPLVVERTVTSSDTQIMQSGGESVRAFLAVSSEQLAQLDGAIDAAERATMHLLSPDQAEGSAEFAGRLVMLMVMNIPGASNDKLLSGALAKLAVAETITVQQSLLLVFARLAIADVGGMLSFLEGQQATKAVLQMWLEKQTDMFGTYQRNVTVAGLCRLIGHGCVDDNVTLGQLTIDSNGQQMPWLARAITIVADEWKAQKERDDADQDDEEEEEEDEDEEEEVTDDREEEEDELDFGEGVLLEDEGEDIFVYENEEEDEIKADPIHEIDLCEYVIKSMQVTSNTAVIKVQFIFEFHL